jgi:thiosulfate/3-mercaptopyruvate sulfurtransferase
VIAPFVDAPWLRDHRDGVVLADVRWYLDGRSGRAAYESGHIPGAVYVDLDTVLAAPPGPTAAAGRHPLPDPATFAAGLAAAGIGDGDTVVGYDDAGGLVAARLVWLLRAIGHEAALLDGGLTGWDGPLETGPRQTTTAAGRDSRFAPQPWPPYLIAGIDEVATTSDVLIDARNRDRFEGAAPDPVDPRSGHIPGARSLPGRESLDERGRLLDPDALRRRLLDVGIGPATAVISYCGSGVNACLNLLLLEHAGIRPGRLYAGSWSEWSRDPSRPAQTGPDAGPGNPEHT